MHPQRAFGGDNQNYLQSFVPVLVVFIFVELNRFYSSKVFYCYADKRDKDFTKVVAFRDFQPAYQRMLQYRYHFHSIKDFIDKYNTVVETISNKLYEERYRDYLPLTEEQREELTDDQIDKWTEKARSGLLRHDAILSDIYSRFRMTMAAVVPGVSGGYVQDGKTVYSDRLSAIGITTTSDYMSGKLVVDENKLREAIEKDPQGILDLFTKNPDEYSEKGIATRLYEDVNYGMERLIAKAGSAGDFKLVDNSSIGKEIKEINERIDTWEDRLAQLEDRYYRQFTAMEKAIQQLNSQSTWLMQQFGMYGQQ